MTDNAKVWYSATAQRTALMLARRTINQLGRALPCTVKAVSEPFVTVSFAMNAAPVTLPDITIPKLESPWIRSPTQVGDVGMTIAASAHIEPITGQGTGTADWKRPAALSALAFLPLGIKGSTPDDPDAAQIMGPNGVIARTADGSVSIVANKNGITLTAGGHSITLNSSGCTISAGTTTIDGIVFDSHVHAGVESGSSVTSGPQG